MTTKVSGLKLNFDEKGQASAIAGEKIKPHRVEMLKEKIDKNELDGLEDLFFNFHVSGCKNISTWDQIQEEQRLYRIYLEKSSALNAVA